MFLLVPIANNAKQRGRFPFFILAVALACVWLHLNVGQGEEVETEDQTSQREAEWEERRRQQEFDDNSLLQYRRDPKRIEAAPVASSAPALDTGELRRLRIEKFGWSNRPGQTGEEVSMRLITHAFLHQDWMHLGFNMLLLALVGVPLETRFGFRRVSSLYVACAISGAFAFLVAQRGQPFMMIGASGAIAGLMGAFLVHFARARFTIFYVVLLIVYPLWGTLQVPAFVFLPVWLGLEVLQGVLLGGLSPVAHSAHIGGFLVGLFIALIWKLPIFDVYDERSAKERDEQRRELVLQALRQRLQKNPENQVLGARTMQAAREMSKSDALSELFTRWARKENGASNIVREYRMSRSAHPGLRLNVDTLWRVMDCAREVKSHRTVIEAAGHLACALTENKQILSVLEVAAAAQEAMGRADLATETRQMLARPERRRSLSPPGVPAVALDHAGARYRRSLSPPDLEAVPRAASKQPVQHSDALLQEEEEVAISSKSGHPDSVSAAVARPKSAAVLDMSRCQAHSLRALGACEQCGVPVCAICSVAIGTSKRLCKECRETVVAAAPGTEAMEHTVLWLGAGWKLLAALTPLMGVIYFLSGPDARQDWEPWMVVVACGALFHAALTGAIMSGVGRGRYVSTVALNCLGLLSFPLGTVFAVLGLTTLARPETKLLYSEEFDRARLVSKEEPAMFRGMAWTLYRIAAGTLFLAAVSVAIKLVVKRRAGLNPQAESVPAVPRFGAWDKEQRLRLHSTLVANYVESGEVTNQHAHLIAEGQVLAVADKPNPVPTEILFTVSEFVSTKNGKESRCDGFDVVTRWTETGFNTDFSLKDTCEWAMRVDFAALMPAWQYGDITGSQVFTAQESGGGTQWIGSGNGLGAFARPILFPLVPEDIEGTLELEGRARCGWHLCFVVRQDLEGALGSSGFFGNNLTHGQFAFREHVELPIAQGAASFKRDQRIEVTGSAVGVGEFNSTSVRRWDVRRLGDNAEFRPRDAEPQLAREILQIADVHRCETEIDKDRCYYDAAPGESEASLCDRIKADPLRTRCQKSVALGDPALHPCFAEESARLRDDCLRDAAMQDRRDSTCDLIESFATADRCRRTLSDDRERAEQY